MTPHHVDELPRTEHLDPLRIPEQQAEQIPVDDDLQLDHGRAVISAISGALATTAPGMEIPSAWAEKAFGLLKGDRKAILMDFDARFGG